MKLTKREQTLTKTYDEKIYVDWEGAFLNLCTTPEDIKLYKELKALAKKVYSQDTNSNTYTAKEYTT